MKISTSYLQFKCFLNDLGAVNGRSGSMAGLGVPSRQSSVTSNSSGVGGVDVNCKSPAPPSRKPSNASMAGADTQNAAQRNPSPPSGQQQQQQQPMPPTQQPASNTSNGTIQPLMLVNHFESVLTMKRFELLLYYRFSRRARERS